MSLSQPLVIPARPDTPIACDMRGARDTPPERVAEYGRLFTQSLLGRRRTADAAELTFRADPGVEAWVTDLVQREAACCPFFSYDVRREGDTIVWRTTTEAGPVADVMLDELVALPERHPDGWSGMKDRLAARGITILADQNGRLVPGGPASEDPSLLGKVKALCGC